MSILLVTRREVGKRFDVCHASLMLFPVFLLHLHVFRAAAAAVGWAFPSFLLLCGKDFYFRFSFIEFLAGVVLRCA